MDIGLLRHRVTLQRFSEQIVRGQIVPSWTTIGDFWARVSVAAATETPDAKGTEPIITYSIVMRHVAEIHQRDRLLYQGRILNVETAIPDDLRTWLEVTAKHIPNFGRSFSHIASGGVTVSGEGVIS